MHTAEGGLSLEMRAAIDACARGVSRGLGAATGREAAMLVAVDERGTASLCLLAEREAAMLWAVREERVAALQALAGRDAKASAGREALAADRAALDSEISVLEAAARRQESRMLLSEGGTFFETSRTTLTAVPGPMLEAMFSGGTPPPPVRTGLHRPRRRALPSHPRLPVRLRLGRRRRRDSCAARRAVA